MDYLSRVFTARPTGYPNRAARARSLATADRPDPREKASVVAASSGLSLGGEVGGGVRWLPNHELHVGTKITSAIP